MKNNVLMWRLIAAVTCGLFPHLATGQMPAELIGTWVIDAKQIEEHLTKVGPPSANAEWLPSIVLRQCVTTMTFEGDAMIIDPISPFPMAQSFRLEPHQDKKFTYSVQVADGGKDTLTITFLSEENITVRSEEIGLDEYGVWKRGKRPNRQTAQKDFKQAFDTCAAALENVPFIKARDR